MATKTCPGCRKQVATACKKCACGHCFTTKKKVYKTKKDYALKKGKVPATVGRGSLPKVPAIEVNGLPAPKLTGEEEFDIPRRRTGRIQREKPNFYDILEFDTEIRKRIRLQKDKNKAEDGIGTTNNNQTVINVAPLAKSVPASQGVSTKDDSQTTSCPKRRGRPPRLNGDKSSNNTVKAPTIQRGITRAQRRALSSDDEPFEKVLQKVTPEKLVHYNLILKDINRKWLAVGWRID